MNSPGANPERPDAAASWIVDSGLIAGGDVTLSGHNVAGRDLYVIHVVQQMQSPPPTMFHLPPDIADFTGRQEHVAKLIGMLRPDSHRTGTAVVVCAIAGKAGVGKTTLAIHVAHRAARHFPDGQLHVDLRGHAETQALNPADVLVGFLREFGVTEMAMPATLEERSRLFRSYVAQKRMLVVLDNAANEAQVRPLLPGSPRCAVLITSRARLAGLEVSRVVLLDVLSAKQALRLLDKIVGTERVARERAASEEIVDLCGALPLALRIAGGRLSERDYLRLTEFAARLRDERRRLGELQIGDREVRGSFALSYQGRDESERRAFRLLGMLAAPDFAVPAAQALLDHDPATTANLVERLVDAQLLEVTGEDARAGTARSLRDAPGKGARSPTPPRPRAGVEGWGRTPGGC